MKLKIKRIHPRAILPTYATPGSACLDLHAVMDDEIAVQVVYPGKAATIRTGLAVEVPEGHVMLIFSRSGHGFKHGVRLSNCVGVIDSDYRGEIAVRLVNEGHFSFNVCAGDRIAQAMIIPVPNIDQIEVVDELSSTERGAGGFGSTGK